MLRKSIQFFAAALFTMFMGISFANDAKPMDVSQSCGCGSHQNVDCKCNPKS